MKKTNFVENILEIYKALNSLFTPTQNVYEGVLKELVRIMVEKI